MARLLRPGGVVALIQTVHICGPSADFFASAQRCYERWDPDTPADLRLPRLEDLPPVGQYALEGAPEFVDTALHRWPVDHEYTADQYLDLVSTFSNHRSLNPARRAGLFTCLRRLIEAEPKQTVVRSSAVELATGIRRGRRRPAVC